MKIRKKIQINALLAISLISALGVFLLVATLKMNATIEEERAVDQIVKGIAEQNIITHEYLLFREQRTQMQWHERSKSLSRLLEYKKNSPHEYRTILKRIQHEHTQIGTIFGEIVAHEPRRGELSPIEQFSFKERENRLIGRLLVKSQNMLTAAFQLHRINKVSLRVLERNIKIVTLVFFIVIIVSSTIASIWIYRSIVKPIDKLEKGINFIGDGILDHKIDIKTKDEIGQLSWAFDQMSRKLKDARDNLHSEIQERMQVNEELRESQQQYRTLADFTYDWETWTDPDGNYVYISPSCERISGYEAEAFIADPDLMIKIAHPDDLDMVKNHFIIGEILESPMHPIDFRITHKSGETVWINHACRRVYDSEGNDLGRRGSNRDITDRKAYQKALEKLLVEKETLMHEIHHRVKNNMTVVSSLLNLQAHSMEDERLKAALMDSRNRVQSMSAIHETLYQSDNISSVDMNIYLSNLAGDIARNHTIDSKVKLKIEADNILIGTKQATPIGLIVNELVTNSFKYAFPDNLEGEIKIILQRSENQIELQYADNGIGIPEGLDWKNSDTMGLKLVRTLVENQLDGSIDLERSNGTKFSIKFNIEA